MRAVVVAVLLLPAPAIDLADVPIFTARCRVNKVTADSASGGRPATVGRATFYLGGVFSPATATVGSPAQGLWSLPLNFNATHAATIAQSYPNRELAPDADLPTHASRPFYEGYAGLSAHLGVGLTGPAPSPAAVVSVECRINFIASSLHPHDAEFSAIVEGRLQNNRLDNSPWNDANPYRQGSWPGNGTFIAYLGLMLIRDNGTDAPAALTWAAWNKLQFWDRAAAAVKAHGGLALAPKHFPIGDTIDSDDDLNSAEATQAALGQLGLNVVTAAYDGQTAASGRRSATEFLTLGAPSLFRKDLSTPGGYSDCSGPASACTLHDYCTVNATDADLINDTDIDRFYRGQVESFVGDGASPHFVLSGEQDEPGFFWPVAAPPVQTSNRVRDRWQRYLAGNGLKPADLGAATWDEVLPLGRTGAGAGTNASSALTLRRRFYWSMRYAVWDATQYMGNSTARLKLMMHDPQAQVYVNFNNFGGRMFVAGNGPAAADPDLAEFGFDWFEWARHSAATLVWTEDWCSDAEAHRWSYFASRMRSAIALPSTRVDQSPIEFGGYIVPRSGGDQEGGLMKRVLSLIGGGAKGFRYFTFGPEYTSPGNGFSDAPQLERFFSEMIQAHTMIAKAEEIMWEARHLAASVAILLDKSSQFWDDWHVLRPKELCLAGCTKSMTSRQTDYFVEAYGLFLALSTDSNVPVDWLDEEALKEPAVLQKYKVVIVTQPNVPVEGITGLIKWANSTGGLLVTTSNAGLYDRYNEPMGVLATASGIKSSPRVRAAVMGQPPIAGTVRVGPVNITASGARNNVNVTNPAARVLGNFSDGGPAILQRPIGINGGSHMVFAWLPGLSYVFSDGGRDPSIRQMLKTLLVDLRKVVPTVVVNTSLVEVPLLIHPDQKRAVVTLLNWTASSPTHPAGAGSNSTGTWRKNSGTASHSIVIHSSGSEKGNEAYKLADGILDFVLGSQGWTATDVQGSEEWIVFDLGAVRPVDGVGLWAAGDGVHDPRALVLQKGSHPTGQDWELVTTFTGRGNTKARQVFPFSAVLSRYFRLEVADRCCHNPATANPSYIAEVEFREGGTGGARSQYVEVQVGGALPFRPATATSVTHGPLELRLNRSSGVASFAVPLLHGDVILLESV